MIYLFVVKRFWVNVRTMEKHSNNTEGYKGSMFSTYCCTSSNDSKLNVDGSMGPATLKAVKKYYGI